MTEEKQAALLQQFPAVQTEISIALPTTRNERPTVTRATLYASFKNDDGSIDWRDCPDCKQSATGMYAGKYGCTRCGWAEGKPTGVSF